jgi:hypothetical protein
MISGALTRRTRGAAAGDRAVGETVVLKKTVIEYQRPGDREVEGKPRGDADDVAAPREQLRR